MIRDLTVTASESRQKRQLLLDKVTFCSRVGEVVGIIGASGSGKTTFFNALAGRFPSRKFSVSGEVLYCASPTETRDPRLGYVSTREWFPPGLTVKEILTTTAALRMPTAKDSERNEYVQGVLMGLDLHPVKDVVAVPFSGTSLLNVSAQKRLALAVESLGDPDIILVDEPTSGLDLGVTDRVLEHLQWLAAKHRMLTLSPDPSGSASVTAAARPRGRHVLCTLHQPTETLFYALDLAVILSYGSVVFCGKPTELKAHLQTTFPSLTQVEWNQYNIVDAALYLSSLRFSLPGFEMSQPQIVYNNSSALTEKKKNDNVQGKLEVTASAKLASPIVPVVPTNAHDVKSRNNSVTKVVHGGGSSFVASCSDAVDILSLEEKMPVASSWFRQFGILLARNFKLRGRDRLTWVLLLIAALIQGLILGSTFWQYSQRNGIDKLKPFNFLRKQYHQIENGNANLMSILKNETLPSKAASSTCHLVDEWGPGMLAVNQIMNHLNFTTLIRSLDLSNELMLDSHWKSSPVVPPEFSFDAFTHLIRNGLRQLEGLRDASFLRDLIEHLFVYDTPTLDFDFFNAYTLVSINIQVTSLLLEHLVRDTTLAPSNRRMLQGLANTTKMTSDLHVDATQFISKLEALAQSFWLTEWATTYVGIEQPLKVFRSMSPVYPKIKAALSAHEPLASVVRDLSQQNSLTSLYAFFEKIVADLYNTTGAVFNIAGCLFFLVLFLGFTSYETLLTFSNQRALFNRETKSGLYHPSAYYVARIFADLLFQLFPGLLMAIIFYCLAGMYSSPLMSNGVTTPVAAVLHHVITYLAVSGTVIFAAYGFSYMVSAIAPSLESSVCAATFCMIIWLCIIGFFMRDNDLPRWITWFKFTSFYRWGFIAFCLVIFPISGTFGVFPNSITNAVAGVTETNALFCSMMVLACGLGYYALGFVFLKYLYRNTGLHS